MNERTSVWNCKCGATNQLRHSKCTACSEPMPKKIKRTIFREELNLQTQILERAIVQKHNLAWKKINTSFSRWERVPLQLLGLFIATFLALILCSYHDGKQLNIFNDIDSIKIIFSENIEPMLSNIWNGISANISGIFENVLEPILEKLFDTLSKIVDKASEHWTETTEFIDKIKNLFNK